MHTVVGEYPKRKIFYDGELVAVEEERPWMGNAVWKPIQGKLTLDIIEKILDEHYKMQELKRMEEYNQRIQNNKAEKMKWFGNMTYSEINAKLKDLQKQFPSYDCFDIKTRDICPGSPSGKHLYVFISSNEYACPYCGCPRASEDANGRYY